MINKTTKRLLTASRLGITFGYADGHRYIEFENESPTDSSTMNEMLNQHNLIPNGKVYGNIIDSLNFVDFLLKKMG